MDPNENLKRMRAAIEELRSRLDHSDDDPIKGDYDVESVVEHFLALDEWLNRGGFLPFDWDR